MMMKQTAIKQDWNEKFYGMLINAALQTQHSIGVAGITHIHQHICPLTSLLIISWHLKFNIEPTKKTNSYYADGWMAMMVMSSRMCHFFEKFIWTTIFLFLQYARLDDIQSQKKAGWNFVLGYFYLFFLSSNFDRWHCWSYGDSFEITSYQYIVRIPITNATCIIEFFVIFHLHHTYKQSPQWLIPHTSTHSATTHPSSCL